MRSVCNVAGALLLFAVPTLLLAGDPKAGGDEGCPMHAGHMAAKAAADGSAHHGAEVDHRHDSFGMSHESTQHSFRLTERGGAIELRVNDSKDASTIAVIQEHLKEIASALSAGDFSAPAFVHGRNPAGVEEMKRMKSAITYRFESLPAGGRIRVSSTDRGAIAAIHDFMKFQIVEHRTADSGKIEDDTLGD
jgi:hypothetical protein